MPSAVARASRVGAVAAATRADHRRLFSNLALGLGGVTATAALAGTATLTAAWMVTSPLAPALRPAAPLMGDTLRLPQPRRADAAEEIGPSRAQDPRLYAPTPIRTIAITLTGAAARSPSDLRHAPTPPLPRPSKAAAAMPLPRPRPERMATAAASPGLARGLTVLPTPRPLDGPRPGEPALAERGAPPTAAPGMAPVVATDGRGRQTDRAAPAAASAPHRARSLALGVLPTPRPVEISRTRERAPGESVPRAAPTIAIAAAGLARPPQRREADRPAVPVAAPVLLPGRAAAKHRYAVLAYNNPDLPTGPDSHTAIYDIVAHTVYMPDGGRLEAHSGLGRLLDDPRYVSAKGRGATPPNLYDLTLRHPLFHGVQAIRLTPAGDARMYGRDGILAHTYMLGRNGQSIGCVSFKDYAQFLHAFLRGEIDKLVVVPHLRTAPWAARARAANGKRYAFNAL